MLVDINGKDVMEINLRHGANTLDVSPLGAGIYLLRMSDGRTARIVKESISPFSGTHPSPGP